MTDVVFANLLCSALYAGAAVVVAVRWGRARGGRWLAAACAFTAVWAASAAHAAMPGAAPPVAPEALEVARTASWVLFLAAAYADGLRHPVSRRRLLGVQLAGGVLAAAVAILQVRAGGVETREVQGLAFNLILYGHLSLITAGLVLLEALMYRGSPDTRWRLRYVCLGVAALLLFDLVATSEALLFGRPHPLLATGRGAAAAMAAPLFALAALRHPRWHIDFTVARRAVFRSAALLGVGIYLIAVAAGGSAMSALGGWGPVPQMALLSAGALAAAALFLSARLRSWLRHLLARLFLSRRYDYRAEWQRFVRTVHSPAHGETLRERALRAVADVVDSPRAGLWLRVGDAFGQVIRLGLGGTEHEVPVDGRFALELSKREGRPLQLDRNGVRNLVWLPDWLREIEAAWLVVPLSHRTRLAGFVVLGRPQVRIDFGWEDEELLRIVAQQAASYLAEEEAIRALEEERRFQEVSRRLAFLAHDLRNLANQFSLMLANARRHIDKPEFQQDLFATMEESVARMHRLLDGIRQERGNTPGGGDAASADLAALVQRFVDAPPADGPELRASLPSTCAVRADRDRLVGITGNLIRNAIEAAGLDGHVDIVLRITAATAVLEIRDDGPGMSPEFLRDRLHHPFHSTKEGGYGLGLYQCRAVAKELGGSLEIESVPGRGTTARLSLPLPDAIGERVSRAD